MVTPRVPTEVDQDTRADASWSAVLGFAQEHNLQFGTDIVFTYGPLGFLATPLVANERAGLRLAVDTLLALITAAGLVLVSRRLGTLWRGLLLATTFFLFANIYPRSDLLIEAGIVCWGLLAMVETGRVADFAVSIFIAVAAFGALVKITLLILACLSAGWVGLDFSFRGRPKRGLWIMVSFVFAFVAGWMLSGQRLLNLGTFLGRAFSTSQGFNLAMGYEGSPELRWRGAFTAVALLSALLLRSAFAFEAGASRMRRLVLGVWSTAIVFLIWKHGFVRTDRYHAGFYFGAVPFLALATDALPSTRVAATLWARVIALICCFVALVTVQAVVLPGDLRFSLGEPFRSLWSNAERLLAPSRYCTATEQALLARRQQLQLPHVRGVVGRSSIDMFGCDQVFVLANHLNYHPRPVFQSYAAYSAPLARLNEDFYLSPAAPDYVLFSLGAQDRKFPPLEDARVVRDLLVNYEPAGAEGGFVLLKGTTKTKPDSKLLRESTARPGERIQLTEYENANLWMEISIAPSLAGCARELVYQPSTIRLTVWYPLSGKPHVRRFHAPPPMLAGGFIISPLLLNNEDVLALYNGAPPTRPTAVALEVDPGTGALWKSAFSYRIFGIQNKLGRHAVQSPAVGIPN